MVLSYERCPFSEAASIALWAVFIHVCRTLEGRAESMSAIILIIRLDDNSHAAGFIDILQCYQADRSSYVKYMTAQCV